MRRFALLLICALLAPYVVRAEVSTSANSVSKLYKTSRARLAIARAKGQKTFAVIIAAKPGENRFVARAIVAAGGAIGMEADDVDYLRATIPIDRVESIADLPQVQTIDANAEITTLMPQSPASPTPEASTSVSGLPTPYPRTAADETALLHPYIAGADIGTLRLRAQHPTFDGRGVTVAVIDATPDFLLPGMQTAENLDGSPAPKFVDIRTDADPGSDDPYTPWFALKTAVHATNGAFTVGNVVYTAPHDGDFLFYPLVNTENTPGATVASLLTTNTPKRKIGKDAPLGAVLWDLSSDVVWVDTSASDHDFRSAKPLRDYAVAHEYDTLPIVTVDPLARPSVGFVVQTDRATKKIALLFGNGGHATMVTSTIAANHSNGSLIEGIAPNASIYSINPWDDTSASVTEAAIIAARDPRVNVLCFEVISALSYGLKNGEFTQSVILGRVAKRYGKPIMFPADNEFGMSTVSEPCMQSDVFCVGAYQSAESYRISYHLLLPRHDNLHFVSSFGPGGDGSLEPTFLAPSGHVSLFLGYYDNPKYGVVKGAFHFRPGYGMGGGTSQATPTAAASIAVLISAAEQSGILVSPERLLEATRRTARYLDDVPAYQQGTGLLQVGAAYDWLAHYRGVLVPQVTFAAPLRTMNTLTGQLPSVGRGLFLREGVVVGRSERETVTITPAAAIVRSERCAVRVLGNDGTFSAPSLLTLVPGHSSSLPVRFTASSYGAHSAILRLYSSDGAVIGQTLLTVVAGETFTPGNRYTIDREIEVPRPGSTALFVTVPPHAQALVLRYTSPRKSPILDVLLPDGTQALDTTYNLLTSLGYAAGTQQTVIPHPLAGTWELQLKDLDDDFAAPAKPTVVSSTAIRLVASVVSVRAQIAGDALTLERTAAPLDGLTVTRTVARTASYTGTLRTGESRIYDIDVPADATGIGASIAAATRGAANAYLFQCDPTCTIVALASSRNGTPSIYYGAPEKGHWRIVVDASAAPRDGVAYHLDDYYTEGYPSNSRASKGRRAVTVVVLGMLANDPFIYYNESTPNKPGGALSQRKGLNPVVFDVLGLP